MATAQQLQEEGTARVLDNSGLFTVNAMNAIRNIPPGAEYIGEEIRSRAEGLGIVPHHPNAWGAVIRLAVKQGYLAPTGLYRATNDLKSHGRKTQVYVRTVLL